MPDPVERSIPKGQAVGEAQAQEGFLAETAGAEEDVPLAGGPIQPEAVDLVTEQTDLEDDEEAPNMVSLEDGDIDLNQMLFAPTGRPGEDVSKGLIGSDGGRTMTDLYDDLIRRGVSAPDVVALAELSRRLGL